MYLGKWSFGMSDPEFQDNAKAVYRLARMFTGDAMFTEDVPNLKYYVYLVVFVILVFFTLLNFLLAIIVNAYTVRCLHPFAGNRT